MDITKTQFDKLCELWYY